MRRTPTSWSVDYAGHTGGPTAKQIRADNYAHLILTAHLLFKSKLLRIIRSIMNERERGYSHYTGMKHYAFTITLTSVTDLTV